LEKVNIINLLIDEVVVISLLNSESRRLLASKQLKESSINNWRFFDAIRPDIDNLVISDYCNMNPKRIEDNNYITGQVGCRRSHIEVLKEFCYSGSRYLLVLEDDFFIEENFDTIISSHYDFVINNKFDILYLGGRRMGKAVNIFGSIFKYTSVYTTHAYIITPIVADFIIKKADYSGYEIDMFYIKQVQKNFDCWCFSPSIVSQFSGESTILRRWVNRDLTR
jgi:GR25 family glycosyltransferase involved in LPS biosynthesis